MPCSSICCGTSASTIASRLERLGMLNRRDHSNPMNVAKRWDARSTSHPYARQAGTLLGGADRRSCCASTPTASPNTFVSKSGNAIWVYYDSFTGMRHEGIKGSQQFENAC